jgi:hypothetical protein
LIFAENPAQIPVASPPGWVVEWLEKRAKAEEKKATPASPPDEATLARRETEKAKRLASRESKAAAGLEELALWLQDLVRAGLATAAQKPFTFWNQMAQRMVDAQVPALARQLRLAATIPNSSEDWPERLLRHLARCLLLIEGFRHLDTLPEPLRADVRQALGFAFKEEEVLVVGVAVADVWHVVGQRTEEEDRLRVQRSWLVGRQTRRHALILSFAFAGQPLEPTLVPGTAFQGELAYYPSASPLRALIKARSDHSEDFYEGLSVYADLAQVLDDHADRLAANPWAEYLPLALGDCHACLVGEEWRLVDRHCQSLPLRVAANDAWRLRALNGGRRVSIFGEWDGHGMTPLAAWFADRYVNTHRSPLSQVTA